MLAFSPGPSSLFPGLGPVGDGGPRKQGGYCVMQGQKPSPRPPNSLAKSLQSCLTLCDPIDSNPPGSPVPGILQARTLEWVAISFSSA